VRGGQLGEGERADEQAEVAQRDVVVVAHRHQVDDDAGEPQRDDVPADPRGQRHEHAGHDLDDADEQHRVVGGAGDDVVDPGSEVVLPVGQPAGELVQAERDRRHGEHRAEQEVGALGAGVRVRRARRGAGGLGGVGVGHRDAPSLKDYEADVREGTVLLSMDCSVRG